MEMGCFLCRPCRDDISKWQGQTSSAVRRGAEESPLLEAVARERLVKIQQTGKGLAGAMEISGGAVITCSYESCVKVINKSSYQSEPRLQSHTLHVTVLLTL
jgi:hypothetical protein